MKQCCCMCKYSGKKELYLFEGKLYCAACLIDHLANRGNLFIKVLPDGIIEVNL